MRLRRDPDDVTCAATPAGGAHVDFVDVEAGPRSRFANVGFGPDDQTASTPPGRSAVCAAFNPANYKARHWPCG